ncbi:regulator of nonsense transcripts 3A [Venturia canescens]|uniref:regulator of nonsense transcripts 3A n=1 Tax=Venturia canescens TaxID=32260 RepID=UPI001C9D4800|nr:regulator of nonsense transcripts 3A [Venturia canescens]
MTEENHQTESSSSSTRSSPLVQAETQANPPPDLVVKNRDIKKEKCRAMTKVVVRRLPPSMSQTQFVEQISPLPEHDYLYFVKADMALGQYAFSRAYINFVDQRDIFIFREKFDNYVFVDAKGTEYPAVVEFAPFQRLPKKRVGKKKDVKCGSIETDPYYISFLESLQNSEGDSATAQPKTEYSYQPVDNTLKKVTTTPLLEYLKQRKQEKQRLKDEKREERRRRDLERRRAKDEPTISKVLKNPEMEKESNREMKELLKDEKEKQTSKETKSRNKREEKGREKGSGGVGGRDRDGKLQSKQQQALNRERGGEERNRDSKHQKRNEEKRFHGKKEEKDRETVIKDQNWYENKYGKKDRNKNDPKDDATEMRDRKFEDRENTKEDRKYEGKYGKKERKNDARDDATDSKEKKLEEKRGKSYEKMRLEKKKLAESKRAAGGGGGGGGDASTKGNSSRLGTNKREERETLEKKEKNSDISQILIKSTISDEPSTSDNLAVDSRDQRDILETGRSRSRLELDLAGETLNQRKDQDFDGETRSKFHESDSIEDDECTVMKKHAKIAQRRSSLESGAEGGGGDDGNRLRRHKSLDGGEHENSRRNDNHYKTKNKKDPRLERRIRNKDRPAMEIYRPGMGKFSKQRLEREKSMNDDRASLSQSPTPVGPSSSSNNVKPSCKQQSSSGQPTASSPSSEARSMSFKRSASRDLP